MIKKVFIKMVTSDLLEEFLSNAIRENSLKQHMNESLNLGNKGFTLLNTHLGCFDRWNLGIAIFGCAVAVITCVFTIYMTYLVKKQIVDQIKVSAKSSVRPCCC